jgi:solute carrier family 35, member F5
VTLSDSSSKSISTDTIVAAQASRPILGDFLALLSALFYALYVILLKVRIKEESRINMQLFFGFVGLINIIVGLPIGLLLHVLNIERFEPPTNARAIVSLIINVSTMHSFTICFAYSTSFSLI